MREFSIVNLGNRYAIMGRAQGDRVWTALYFVCALEEAEEFVEVCRSASKTAMEIVRSKRIGRDVRVRLSVVSDAF